MLDHRGDRLQMRITVNGEALELEGPLTVSALLSELELVAQKIAVERNLEIVPKSTFNDELIQDGDRLEIVQFVGGG